jgi:hypothetical protein
MKVIVVVHGAVADAVAIGCDDVVDTDVWV